MPGDKYAHIKYARYRSNFSWKCTTMNKLNYDPAHVEISKQISKKGNGSSLVFLKQPTYTHNPHRIASVTQLKRSITLELYLELYHPFSILPLKKTHN